MSVFEGARQNLALQGLRRRADRPISLVVLAGLLRASDLLIVFASGLLIHRIYLEGSQFVDWHEYYLAVLLAVFVAGPVFSSNGVYRLQGLSAGKLGLGKLVASWGLVILFLIFAGFVFKISRDFSRIWIGVWFFVALVPMVAVRGALWLRARSWVAHGRLSRNVAIVGGGEHGARLIAALGRLDEEGVNIIGIFDDRSERVGRRVAGVAKIGNIDDLVIYARNNRVDEIILALPWAAEARIEQVLRKLRSLPVDIRLAPDRVGFRLGHSGYSSLGGVPLLDVCKKPLADWHSVIKSVEDRTLAILLLVFLGPLFGVVALAIKLDSRGPVFFRQRRYGFNNHTIGVYKFRTMYHHLRDENAAKLTTRNDPRVTRVGAFLRQTSIDELPQLINVLKGEMSIIGPRPHALSAKAADRLYEEVVAEYAARHRVKPGITGWAQVKGWRGETDTVEKIQKRVEHDLFYIENWSFALDLKILFLTFFALLRADAY